MESIFRCFGPEDSDASTIHGVEASRSDPPSVYLAQPKGTIDQAVVIADVYFYAIDETMPGLVVTPTCDFAQDKCDLAHVCAVRDAWAVVNLLLHGSWKGMGLTQQSGALIPGPLSSSKAKEMRGNLRGLITQRFPRYHWLAPLPGGTVPKIVDFQLMSAFALDELEESTIVAELQSPFREAVAARYAAYMGRVGTPDFSQEQIDEWIEQGIDLLFPEPHHG